MKAFIFIFLLFVGIQNTYAQNMINKKDLTLLVGYGFREANYKCVGYDTNPWRTESRTNCFGVYYVGLNYALSKRFSVGVAAQAYQTRSKYKQTLNILGGGSVIANVKESRTFASFPLRFHWNWLNKNRFSISSNIGVDFSLISYKSSHDQMDATVDTFGNSNSGNYQLAGSDMRIVFMRFPTWNPEAIDGFPVLNGCLLDIRFGLSDKIGLFLSGPTLNLSFFRAGISFELFQDNSYSITN